METPFIREFTVFVKCADEFIILHLFQGPTGVSGPKGARGAQGAPVRESRLYFNT